MGLPPAVARRLAEQTVAGSAALAAASPDSPAELRRIVTSPGGTTEAAMAVLETRGARDAFIAAVLAARAKAEALGKPAVAPPIHPSAAIAMSYLSYLSPTGTSPWHTYLAQVDRVLPYLGAGALVGDAEATQAGADRRRADRDGQRQRRPLRWWVPPGP